MVRATSKVLLSSRLFRGDGVSREEHFLDDVQWKDAQEMGQPAGVVGNAELRGSDGEGGRWRADHEVARRHHVARPAPDARVNHGHDRGREGAYAMQQALESRLPRDRVPPVDGDLVDVVTGGPDLGPRVGPQDDDPHPRRSKRSNASSMEATTLRLSGFTGGC